MKTFNYIVLFIIICIFNTVSAQNTELDTSIVNATNGLFEDTIDTLNIDLDFLDSINVSNNLLSSTDTLIIDSTDTNIPYTLSNDAIEDEVIYEARDSSYLDLENKLIHLYGAAKIDYQILKVTANYMTIDFANNRVQGYAQLDTMYKNEPKPTFSDGENTFTYKEMAYNFKTKKGFVTTAITQQGEFNLVGNTTKYIFGGVDSLGQKIDDRAYNKDAIITTCNHYPPHYGIKADKLKFVPNKVAVMSIAQLEIANVPTPIFLPFGFFPLAKGKSSGIIFPSNYEYNDQLGLGFRDIGYYWPVNNNLDLKFTGDIYTRGSHALRTNANYKKRYAYNGNILLSYANNIQERSNDGTRISNKSFSINIRHTQDPKAHPYRSLGGNINIQTNRHDQRVFENPNAALTNTYSSGFTFAHEMPGTPFRFTAEFRHSQNIQTRIMDITLPNMSLRMNTIFPFKKKNSTRETWTDRIALGYSSEFRNFVKTTDTTLFTMQTLDNMQSGLQNKGNLSTNFRILKYINVSPNMSYQESWLTQQYELELSDKDIRLDTTSSIPERLRDTLGFRTPDPTFRRGLFAHRDFNASVSLNTQIFGKREFKGFIRGIRHVVKPSLNFVYRPGSKERYESFVDTDLRPEFNDPRPYNIFTNSPFGTLSGNEEQAGITYGILNVFEAKYFSKKDSLEKVIRIFDNININGGYNVVADSFKFSAINVSGNTTVFKKLTNFNFNAVFSPYVMDENNRRTQTTVWKDGKILPAFVNFRGQFSTGFSVSQIVDFFSGKKNEDNKNTPQNASTRGGGLQANTPTNETSNNKQVALADWFANFRIAHAWNFEIRPEKNIDTFIVTSHSINISGSIPLSKNWNINIGNIAYDLKRNSLIYPFLSFARDLHCWEMNFTWAPQNGVYSFFIGVKSNALEFLKYDVRQRNAQTLFTGVR